MSEYRECTQPSTKGQFSVQMGDRNHFGRNEADKTIENNISRDIKTKEV